MKKIILKKLLVLFTIGLLAAPASVDAVNWKREAAGFAAVCAGGLILPTYELLCGPIKVNKNLKANKYFLRTLAIMGMLPMAFQKAAEEFPGKIFSVAGNNATFLASHVLAGLAMSFLSCSIDG